jgi:hypothetical protein
MTTESTQREAGRSARDKLEKRKHCDTHERTWDPKRFDDCPQCKNDRVIDSMVAHQAGPGATRAQKRRAREIVMGRDSDTRRAPDDSHL